MITQAPSQASLETLRDAETVRMRRLFRAAKAIADKLEDRETTPHLATTLAYQRLPKGVRQGYRDWQHSVWHDFSESKAIGWKHWQQAQESNRVWYYTSTEEIYFRLLASHALIGSLDPDRYANRVLAAERMACRMTQVLQRAGHGDLIRICLHRF
jgi:hypothetical protein